MIEIKAKNGQYLTQAAEVNDNERIFISAIKGVNAREDEWREASEAEKLAFEEAQEEKRKQEENQNAQQP